MAIDDENTRLNAVELLRQDHEKVKKMFSEFESSKDSSIIDEAIKELLIHSAIEEEIFYPEARRVVGDEELMDEALEEHHVVALLIDELAGGKGGERRDAKFLVLTEAVKHHIEEEESEMLPKIEHSELDVEELGARMLERKEELMGRSLTTLAGKTRRGRKAPARRPARAAMKSRRGGARTRGGKQAAKSR